jgi:hypothetical protein
MVTAVLGVLAASSMPAYAKGVTKYRGIHPLPPHGGEFCYLEVPHVHARAPSDMRVYRTLPDGENVFVGDDVALGYDGSKHAFFGPHPLSNAALPSTEKFYCYIRGAHFHATAPAAGPSFVSKDGVAWYVGEFGPEFEREKHNLWINDSGALPSYVPPKVTLADAPPGYHLPALAEPPKPPAPPAAAGKPGTKPTAKGAVTKAAAKADAQANQTVKAGPR